MDTINASQNELTSLLLRSLITKEVRRFFSLEENDFVATDDDVNAVLSVLSDMAESNYSDLNELNASILDEECMFDMLDTGVRIDSKTGRLITQGWCLYNGKYFFGDPEDALKQVQKDGFENLSEAFDVDKETYAVEHAGW